MASGSNEWFSVDRAGMRKVLAGRGVAPAVLELLQNALDEPGVTKVSISMSPIPNSRASRIQVEDDAPDGFADLSHAHTLYAESRKRSNALQRGKWCIGEKKALSLCDSAEVISTRGGFRFDDKGRHRLKRRRDRGSLITMDLRMTAQERAEAERLLRLCIVPESIAVTFNGAPLSSRVPAYRGSATLPTELADAEGILRRRDRKADIALYRPEPGESPWLYELGLPVMELPDDAWSVDVGQKIPLNSDRDGVPDSFVRLVRAAVLNLTHGELDASQAASPWVRDALASEATTTEAATDALTARFGEKAVVFDPSDREANQRAVALGYQVIHGAHLSAAEWHRVRETGFARPAGQVTPTARPFSEGGKPLKMVEKLTPRHHALIDTMLRVAKRIGTRSYGVRLAADMGWPFAACIDQACDITFNVARHRLPDIGEALNADIVDTLLHEMAHREGAESHLDEGFHRACTRLGGLLAVELAGDPGLLTMRQDA